MVCDPTINAGVVQAPVPVEVEAFQVIRTTPLVPQLTPEPAVMGFPLSVKVTIPGTPRTLVPSGLGVTVAVNVTDWLSPDGSAGLLTTTAVFALVTV